MGKHCLVYCGDDRCNCECAPRYQNHPLVIAEHQRRAAIFSRPRSGVRCHHCGWEGERPPTDHRSEFAPRCPGCNRFDPFKPLSIIEAVERMENA